MVLLQVRIKCRDHVSKVALYRERLAVQLPDRIAVYELGANAAASSTAAAAAGGGGGGDGGVSVAAVSGDNYDMHYRTKDKVYRAFNAEHLGERQHHGHGQRRTRRGGGSS